MAINNYLPDSTQYTISPYESHSTSIVNRLSHLHTYGKNCILGHKESLQVEYTPGDTTAVLSSGKCVIDDVLIELTEPHIIDLIDPNNFVGESLNITSGAEGYYYVCIYYKYLLSRTTPEAYIKIFNPLNTDTFVHDSNYLILKVFEVEDQLGANVIIETYDYDPDIVDNNRRYKENYCEFFEQLPTFESDDTGRMIAVSNYTDVFNLYIGGLVEWNLINTGGEISEYMKAVLSEVNPTVTDDEYGEGTFWLNTITEAVFICAHQESGNASWIPWITELGTYVPLSINIVDPTTSDNTYSVGTIWLNTTDQNIYILMSITVGVALWIQLNPSFQVNLKKYFLL